MNIKQTLLLVCFTVFSTHTDMRDISCFSDYEYMILLIELYEDNPTFGVPNKGNKHVKLENTLLKKLDGIPYMIDGVNIKESMIIIRDLLEIQLGKIDRKTGKRAGRYFYKGMGYGTHYLIKFERDNPRDKEPFKALLQQAKQDIIDQLQPFIDQVGATQWIVLPIMEEWVVKRKRNSTLLLKWADCQGEELKMFDTNILSLHELDAFCTDLRIFLGDLIYNCPKGYAQFQNLLKEHENNK